MEIRLATKEHLSQIEPLYQALFATTADLEPYFFTAAQQDRTFLEGTIENDDSDLIIAVMNEQIVGVALMQMQETPPYNVFKKHHFAYLVDLITKPTYRGQGIASTLLAECERWAKTKGADYLELSVLNKNTNAYDLYLKKGFSEKITTLYKPID